MTTPLQSQFPEELLITEEVESWEKTTICEPQQIRRPRRDLTHQFAVRVFQEMGRLRAQGTSSIEMQAAAPFWRGKLNEFAQAVYSKKEESVTTQLDEEIAAIRYTPPTHHEALTTRSLVVEAIGDVAGHELGEILGGPCGMGLEFGAHVLASDLPKDSKSPYRDLGLTASSQVATARVAALLFGWVGVAVVVAAPFVEKGGRVAETKFQERYEELCSDKSLVNLYLCPQLNEGILWAKGLQLPSKILHTIQETVTEHSAKALDATHVTDETLKKASDTLQEAVHESYEQKRQHPELLDILS